MKNSATGNSEASYTALMEIIMDTDPDSWTRFFQLQGCCLVGMLLFYLGHRLFQYLATIFP